ncbi:coiled-coil domain-containing protein 77 isoform X3 [Hemitrygon akajei]|uniref:coiled-coil domain-containing protein 77 isoform X3 n=1 Tax=Hemitrygon akajei TaxID=2704970 RepID=UPI003BF96194
MESRGCGARSTMGRNSAHSNKQLTPQHDRSPPIPSVNERLAFLRPSRELLEYYRKKIAQFDEEHENLMGKLEKYKATYEEQHKLQWEIRQREEEIEELQKALSDMQVYLFQEREHALRLYAENDRLKIRELEDRKKIQHLLTLVGSEEEALTYFHKEPPHKVINEQDLKSPLQLVLLSQKITNEIIKLYYYRLQKTQNLLYESTRDYLQLKFEGRDIEKVWMAEKDHLLQELDRYSRQRNRCCENETQLLQESPMEREIQRVQSEEIKSLEEQLNQAHRLADMYREQCVTLEDNLARIQEEGDIGQQLFKERSDKTVKRLQLMTQRYEALEKRRAMEVEGFKNDIKLLRQRLKDVEKQLFKVTLGIGPDQDLAILHEVRQSNNQSKMIQGELRKLKAKIYGLENQLRFG